MSWIDLNKSEPDCYQRVLCHRPGKFVVIGKAILGSNGCTFTGENGLKLLEVTHWQPLPEPPTT